MDFSYQIYPELEKKYKKLGHKPKVKVEILTLYEVQNHYYTKQTHTLSTYIKNNNVFPKQQNKLELIFFFKIFIS